MLLNLGHTVGHALETSTGYKKLSHGEGVLLGCVCESKIALDKGVLAHEDFDRIITLITRLPLTNMNRHLEPGRLIEFMKSDKKSVAGKIKFVLPARIGETVTRDDVGEQEIASAIAYLERLSS
jgi:3-dehydroquinate synthase